MNLERRRNSPSGTDSRTTESALSSKDFQLSHVKEPEERLS